MTSTLSDWAKEFLREDRVGVVGTLNADGSPHLTTMWYLLADDDTLIISTLSRNQKVKNLRHDPRITFCVGDKTRSVSLSGHVTISEDKEDTLSRMVHASVTIQVTPESRPATPSWMGEVAVFAQIFTHAGILQAITEQVRFARARFGKYDLIDFFVVLIGYVLSGEPTLLTFYERLAPFAEPFTALFGRHRLPHRSTLSRFLAALDHASVEALRTLFRDRFASPSIVCFPWRLI